MIDIPKQITYWTDGAAEDWEVAQALVRQKRIRHGLFFAHLTLEKILKAYVCRHTDDIAPKIHNLVRLAELSEAPIDPSQIELLSEANSFVIEGRYPETLIPPPSQSEANTYIKRIGELYQWLMKKLSE